MPDDPSIKLNEVEFFAFVQSLAQKRYSDDLFKYCEQAATGIVTAEDSLKKLSESVLATENDVGMLLRFIFHHLILAVIGSNHLLFANCGNRLLAIQPRVSASPDKFFWDILSIIYKLIRNQGPKDSDDAIARIKFLLDNKPPTFSQVYPIAYFLVALEGLQHWSKERTNTGISKMLSINEDTTTLQKPEQTLFFVLASFLRPGLRWVRKELNRSLSAN